MCTTVTCTHWHGYTACVHYIPTTAVHCADTARFPIKCSSTAVIRSPPAYIVRLTASMESIFSLQGKTNYMNFFRQCHLGRIALRMPRGIDCSPGKSMHRIDRYTFTVRPFVTQSIPNPMDIIQCETEPCHTREPSTNAHHMRTVMGTEFAENKCQREKKTHTHKIYPWAINALWHLACVRFGTRAHKNI